MTRDEQLNLIRTKCIEANPEIAVLKVGCIVLAGDAQLPHTVYGIDEGIVSAYLNRPFPKEMEANDFYDCEFGKHYEGGNLKIIGRPIRLADVLFATCKKTPAGYVKTVGQAQNDIVVLWNWGQDHLTEQSNETIASIYQIYQLLK